MDGQTSIIPLRDGDPIIGSLAVFVAVAGIFVNFAPEGSAGCDRDRERRARHLARVLDDGLRRNGRADAREKRQAVERRGDLCLPAAFIAHPRPPIDPRGALREIDAPPDRSFMQDGGDQKIAPDQILVFDQVGATVRRILERERAHHGRARSFVLMKERVEKGKQLIAQLNRTAINPCVFFAVRERLLVF